MQSPLHWTVALAIASVAVPGGSRSAAAPNPTTATPAKAPASPLHRLSPELALEVRRPESVAIAPDGSAALLTIKENRLEDNASRSQVYLLSLASGQLRQLTFSGKNNLDAVWSPDGSQVAFAGTHKRMSQIFVLDLKNGGEARAITDLPSGASGPVFSPDGRWIAFTSDVDPECATPTCNKEHADARAKRKVKARAYDDLFYRHWNAWDEGTRSHLFLVAADGSSAPWDATPGLHHVPSDALSGGRGYAFAGSDALVYCANLEPNRALSTNNDLFEVKVRGGDAKPLTAANKALDANPVVSPDGRWLAYVSFLRPGFEADRGVLTLLERATGKAVRRTESFDRSVEDIAWAPDSASLYFVAQDRGRNTLFAIGRDAGEPRPLTQGRSVSHVSVARNGLIAFVASSFREPPEVYVLDPRTGEAKRASHLNDALAATLDLGAVESLDVDVHGSPLHGFVLLPPGFEKKRRYPLLMMIHGGPEGAWLDEWHARWNAQLFAARGYVVAMPNFRGSTGYGQKFTDAIAGDWGGGPYEDVMAFTDAMEKKPFIARNDTCAAGASYGGYMIDWIAGHTDRFKCLITHAGVFNLEAMWGDTEEVWFPEWELGGTPWAARDAYRRWSPHEYIQNARTPTLVVHGQLDYRVNLSQGMQMFQSLRRNGVPARFVYFPDEGHWVARPQNYVYWYSEMLGWLAKYLH